MLFKVLILRRGELIHQIAVNLHLFIRMERAKSML